MAHEAPAQITPAGLADYMDVLTKAVFQPGMSWAIVDKKWPGTREALHGFDPVAIAELTPPEIDTLATDTRLIRNRKKIEATVHNAGAMLAAEREFGSFPAYLSSFGDFDALVKDMRKRFKFLGEMGAYYFLYVVGEPVPDYDTWCASRGR
jgi:3-methyladenine DNA glycosylase Tag